MANVNKTYTVDEIEYLYLNNILPHDMRHTVTNEKYMIHKIKVLQKWLSFEDYIRHNYLNIPYTMTANGLKKCEHVSSDVVYNIAKNKFPYNVTDGKHYVLWATEPLISNVINKIIKQHFVNRSSFWFEQPREFKSVKGVWHAHIFVKYNY